MIDALPLLLSDEGYQISRSVRLRSSASAYFNRTPASASNRQIFTWSGWVKLGAIGAVNGPLFQGYSSSTERTTFGLQSDVLYFIDTKSGTSTIIGTSAVFRDPSAWYHIVMSVDTTQATSANRCRIYINSVQQTLTGTQVAQNTNTYINANTLQYIGNDAGAAGRYLDGYLTEINFIDGQALTPSSFGETNPVTGVWQPKKYAGTYGTNGFYLNFSDNSAATAAAIGKDYSGNGNNWTPNNISVTAGVTYDSMLDVPTQWADGGNGRGNYAVLNPLNKGTNQTIASGNLSNTASGHGTVLPTIGVTSGLWYAEVTLTTSGAGGIGFTINPQAESSYGEIAGKWWCYDNGAGFYIISQTTTTASLATKFSAGQVWQWAIDTANGKLWIGLDNSWFSSAGATTGNPATGANPTFTFTAGTLIWPILENAGGPVWNANFGQRPFAYTPPTGFKALNTLNLPTPTILKGNQYFDATIWTGTNGVAGSVVNAGGFQPDFIWGKSRNNADSHTLIDAVRGGTKGLFSDLTLSEQTNAGYITSFNSNGFSYGVSSSFSNGNLVAWQWKEGATQGFDIVIGTSPASGNFNVSHSLGVVPAMIILKDRTNAGTAWGVWHRSLANPAQSFLQLNNTNAVAANANIWGNTAPTSTQFTTQSGQVVLGSANYVAYLFAEVAGFSKAFSYTGNGSADGPFVFCGFRPRWVMWKCSSDASTDWVIYDSARDTYNVMGEYLLPNSSAAGASNAGVDFLSNGFKIKLAGGGSTNTSGRTYIGFALAENPFKNSLAR